MGHEKQDCGASPQLAAWRLSGGGQGQNLLNPQAVSYESPMGQHDMAGSCLSQDAIHSLPLSSACGISHPLFD